jgi:hypothetical protein
VVDCLKRNGFVTLALLRLVHTVAQDAVRSRSGFGHKRDVVCTRMSDSSDVSAAVSKETEKKINKKKKRMWFCDVFVSRSVDGEFRTLFQRLR